MTSYLTDEFIRCFRKLPEDIKQQARKSYRLWKKHPLYPSLHFKCIHVQEPLYSVRIGIGWRALGIVEDETITWIWIGSHAEYDRLLKRL